MTFIFSLLLTLALTLTSVPGEAATPVTACGEVIDAAGDYQLTGDLGPCAGDGVVITASNVNFDLAGFTITGVSSLQSCNIVTPQYGINVSAAVTNVHLSGGTVINFVDGIVLFASQSSASAPWRNACPLRFVLPTHTTGRNTEASRLSKMRSMV